MHVMRWRYKTRCHSNWGKLSNNIWDLYMNIELQYTHTVGFLPATPSRTAVWRFRAGHVSSVCDYFFYIFFLTKLWVIRDKLLTTAAHICLFLQLVKSLLSNNTHRLGSGWPQPEINARSHQGEETFDWIFFPFSHYVNCDTAKCIHLSLPLSLSCTRQLHKSVAPECC